MPCSTYFWPSAIPSSRAVAFLEVPGEPCAVLGRHAARGHGRHAQPDGVDRLRTSRFLPPLILVPGASAAEVLGVVGEGNSPGLDLAPTGTDGGGNEVHVARPTLNGRLS